MAGSTKTNDKPLQVPVDRISFKTKCQLMQEESENGEFKMTLAMVFYLSLGLEPLPTKIFFINVLLFYSVPGEMLRLCLVVVIA